MSILKILREIKEEVKDIELEFNKLRETIKTLKNAKRVLLLTTSNRGSWLIKEGKADTKSGTIAKIIKKYLGDKCEIIDVSLLKIDECEGNVSLKDGNSCGIKKAILKNKTKNPSGEHRCWASINNKEDELWKVSKPLLESDVVIFFGSVRWGQMNAVYQRLIERLTWLENRHRSYNESNILKKIKCGIIASGHNWNGKQVVKTQKEALSYFGFDVKDELCWDWSYTKDSSDESLESYNKANEKFDKLFKIKN